MAEEPSLAPKDDTTPGKQKEIDYPQPKRNAYYNLPKLDYHDRFKEGRGLRLVGKQRLTFIFDRSLSRSRAFSLDVGVPDVEVGNTIVAPTWAVTHIAEFSARYAWGDHHLKVIEMISYPFAYDAYRRTLSVACALTFEDQNGDDAVMNEVAVDLEFWAPVE